MTEPDVHDLMMRASDRAAELASPPLTHIRARDSARSAQRRRRRLAGLALAATVVLVLGALPLAIALSGRDQAAPAAAPSTSLLTAVPFGVWQVSETSSATPAGTRLVLGTDHANVMLPCGKLSGDWVIDANGAFGALIWGATQGCTTGNRIPTVPWLSSAVSLWADGSSLILVDAAGRSTARLSPTADSAPSGSGFATAPSLPRGLSAPSLTDLIGSWLPEHPPASLAHMSLTIGPSGSISTPGVVTTGICPWWGSTADLIRIGSNGHVMTLAGPRSAIGCAVPEADRHLMIGADRYAIWAADRVGVDTSARLVLVDDAGAITSRWHRTSS